MGPVGRSPVEDVADADGRGNQNGYYLVAATSVVSQVGSVEGCWRAWPTRGGSWTSADHRQGLQSCVRLVRTQTVEGILDAADCITASHEGIVPGR